MQMYHVRLYNVIAILPAGAEGLIAGAAYAGAALCGCGVTGVLSVPPPRCCGHITLYGSPCNEQPQFQTPSTGRAGNVTGRAGNVNSPNSCW